MARILYEIYPIPLHHSWIDFGVIMISIFVSLTVAKTMMKIRQDYYVAPTSIGTVCSTILSSANI